MVYKGCNVNYPYYLALPDLEQFHAAAQDVAICGFPKSGTDLGSRRNMAVQKLPDYFNINLQHFCDFRTLILAVAQHTDTEGVSVP